MENQNEEMLLSEQIQAEVEKKVKELKAADPMEWVGRMNNIRSRAMEIVNSELIYN